MFKDYKATSFFGENNNHQVTIYLPKTSSQNNTFGVTYIVNIKINQGGTHKNKVSLNTLLKCLTGHSIITLLNARSSDCWLDFTVSHDTDPDFITAKITKIPKADCIQTAQKVITSRR